MKDNYYSARGIHKDIRVYLELSKQLDFAHIHFGLFTDKPSSLKEAQEEMSLFVQSMIPETVSTVVDVGGGIGGLSNLLRTNREIKSLCVVPDPLLIEYGVQRFPAVSFCCARADDFKVDTKFDLALLFESYQYFRVREKSLRNIAEHLSANGYLLLVDEFSLNSGYLPQLEETQKLLSEFGFKLLQDEDLSNRVVETCDMAHSLLIEHGLAHAEQWLRTKESYLSSRREYHAMLFQKTF